MLTQKFLELFNHGAEWVTWLLLGVSVLGTAVVIDRALLLLRTQEGFPALRAALAAALGRGDVTAALALAEGDTLARNVLRAGLLLVTRGERRSEPVEQAMLGSLAAQRARYEARLSSLVTIGNVSPLLGLLGTVIGIVQAFLQLGQAGTTQAASNTVVMSAIGEALVATGIGIGAAVPAVVIYNWLRAAVTIRIRQSEALQRELIAALGTLPARDDGGEA